MCFLYSIYIWGSVKYFVAISSYMLRSLQLHVRPPTPPNWSTISCRLLATAYSMYSQLPSKAGGCILLQSKFQLFTHHFNVLFIVQHIVWQVSRPAQYGARLQVKRPGIAWALFLGTGKGPLFSTASRLPPGPALLSFHWGWDVKHTTHTYLVTRFILIYLHGAMLN
jgi:hypothetical protein